MQQDSDKYRITFKRNISMFRHFGLVFLLLIIFGPIYFYYRDPSINMDIEIIKITSYVLLIMLVPNFILHVNYLYENLFTTLEVDKQRNILKITDKKGKYVYKFEEITISKLYKSIYYKNKIDNLNRIKTLISDYGYWYVKFNDNKKFIFTSLMIDWNSVSFIKNTMIEYSLIPLIGRDELTTNELLEKKINKFEKNVEHFMTLFKELPISELKSKIDDSNSFTKEAVEACKRLLAKMNEDANRKSN